MLHKKRILQALYVSMRRRIRILLQIKPRAKPPPILGQSLESIVARHGWIAESLLEHLPAELDLQDKSVCEIGSGDCLAAVSLYLAKGASHVDIVDAAPLVVNEKQLDLLETLEKQGLPMDTGIIPRRSSPQLDANRVSHHRCYMENFSAADKYDLLSSFSVVEHVEEMEAFYFSCWKALKRGGWMLHIIDLGGHEQFEDPLPPLDFQTYPDWLYSLMYPRHYRATRRFLGEHKQAVTDAGFVIKEIKVRRQADLAYLAAIWPKLRAAARVRPIDEVGVIEFALLARKE
jgi:hypothetical protein